MVSTDRTDTAGRTTAESLAPTLPDLGLPPARNQFKVDHALRVPTRDGETLLTDHYMPETDSPRGTILVRSPYGRGAPFAPLLAEPYAERGYHVLLQSVRGMHGSSGPFEPMIHEAADAHDTLTWIREQGWFDGRLGTLGASYLGFVQYGLMMDAPPELKASVVMMAPHNFAEMLHGHGTFALQMALGWSDVMSAQLAGLAAPEMQAHLEDAGERLESAFTSLPLAEAAEEALAGRVSWYREWALHPDTNDAFWDGYDFSKALGRTRGAVLLAGGWRDLFLGQMAEQYAELHRRGIDVALTIGDWEHSAPIADAAATMHQQALAWFDEHLAGVSPARQQDPVRVELVGAGRWLEFPEWPPPATDRAWHLTADGLLREVPHSAAVPRVSFVYDPENPTPTVGGPLLAGGGRLDNRELESRSDVVTFSSGELQADLDVIGVIKVELGVQVDNPYADVFVRICDVGPDGRSLNVTDALIRLNAALPVGQLQRLSVDLLPCAYRFAAGHQLRLQISGGAHPRFARNLGVPGVQNSATETRPSHHAVVVEGSRITLPIFSH
ncbi:CocE/NonD family hydrolase [Kribbella sp. DT2]|uniref:CocE/NonD family hydrolase n=1 Tax=Kribbella sp. DT2 TaxID=3393427 RepID=UPI003CF0E1A7